MAEAAPRRWTIDEFFAWQERQSERHQPVAGFPLGMTVGVRNVHDDVAVNIIAALGNQLRGKPYRPCIGRCGIETLPSLIRKPDVGVDCGRRAPEWIQGRRAPHGAGEAVARNAGFRHRRERVPSRRGRRAPRKVAWPPQ